MNKKKIKNYLQLGILLFGISLFLLNCERQEHHETTNLHYSSIKSYQVNKKDIPNIMGFINNDKARTSFSCGSIDDSVIYAAIDSLNIHTYTFPFYVEETPEDTFYNFVVKTSEEVTYQPFIFKYIASNGFEVGVDDFDTFEGTLEIYHYDTFCGDGSTAGRTDEDDPCPTNTVGLHSGSGSNSEPGNNNDASDSNPNNGEDYYNNSGGEGSSAGTGGYSPCIVRITWSCDYGGTTPHAPAVCGPYGNGPGSTPTVSVYCPPSYNRTDDPCQQQEDFSGATAVNDSRPCPRGYVKNAQGQCVKQPCEGDPVSNPQVAQQYGPSGIKGALFGNENSGGCTRYGGNHCNTPRNKRHNGLDIKNNIGDPIHIMHGGFVYSSGYSDDYGYYATIQSTVNGETILTTYAHMQKDNRIEQGPSGSGLVHVSTGQILGYQGDSGNIKDALAEESVDPHVHIEVRKHDGSSSWDHDDNFEVVDPREYLSTTIDDNGVTQTNNCN